MRSRNATLPKRVASAVDGSMTWKPSWFCMKTRLEWSPMRSTRQTGASKVLLQQISEKAMENNHRIRFDRRSPVCPILRERRGNCQGLGAPGLVSQDSTNLAQPSHAYLISARHSLGEKPS